MTRLSHIQYAVPQTLHARLDIATAIRALAAADNQCFERSVTLVKVQRDFDLIAEIVRDTWQILAKSGYDPNEPRVPAGNPDGGQWTEEGGGTQSGGSGEVLSDATPEDNWVPGAQYAANDSPRIGHNHGPPLEDPPEIPPELPATKQAINTFLKAAAYWLEEAGLAEEPVGDFILALQAAGWLSNYLPYVYAYLDPPKTLEELQQDALSPAPGYNIHHIVEQTSAMQDGYPRSMIDDPDNLVRIPTLTHWQITTWFQTANPNYNDFAPRDYLRGKSWDERRRVGLDALIRFGVLTP